jgi:glycosyltransferase involved in cell wall biosynthesis
LEAVRPVVVVLQHHTGFLGVGDYSKMIAAAKRMHIPVIVECHDAAQLERGQIALLTEAGAKIFVHSSREAERLETSNVVVRPLPVRVFKSDGQKASRVREEAAPIIGGFGFFREYKGIDIALESVKQLREEFPGLQYRGWHAVYPGEEQSSFVRKCFSLIEREGLGRAVTIDTSFSDIEKIVVGLSQCDVVVLPYAESNEGASAAANIALAAGVPLVISDSKIFSMLQHVAKVVKVRSGRSFANAIAELLRDEQKRLELAEGAKRWAEGNSYLSMAHQILDLVG